VSPASVSFGKQPEDNVRRVDQLTFKNHGTGPATIEKVQIIGHTQSGFFIATDTCPDTLAPGKECQVGVGADPQKPGKATGEVEINENADGQPSTTDVPLSVDGTPDHCRCISLKALYLDDFKSDRAEVTFKLHWEMGCSGGSGRCYAVLYTRADLDGHHVLESESDVECQGTCGAKPDVTDGEGGVVLPLTMRTRRNGSLTVITEAVCPHAEERRTFKLQFDSNGRPELPSSGRVLVEPRR
jgi:hypothetical protein